jgi:hypothetical protein
MIEPGKRYYFLLHAYHHFLGEVAEVTGRRSCVLRDVRRVQSCRRGWTAFFRDGAGADTDVSAWPDGTEIEGWLAAAPWPHPIPEAPR